MSEPCKNCDRVECRVKVLGTSCPPPITDARVLEWHAQFLAAIHDCRDHTVDWRAEALRLRAKIAAVQDVVNSTTIRTRIDEAWVEKLCRALDAMPATDMQDKASFAETQQIRYVRK